MNEGKVLIALVAGVVLFLVSIGMSLNELRYAAFSKTTDARIVQKLALTQKNSRRSAARTIYEVTYEFTDAEQKRKETDTAKDDYPFPSGGTVAVEYIPGSIGSSRLAGHGGAFWIYVMLVCLALAGFTGWRFWKFYKS